MPGGAGASPQRLPTLLKAGIKLRSSETIGVKITLSEFPFSISPLLGGAQPSAFWSSDVGAGALGTKVVATLGV